METKTYTKDNTYISVIGYGQNKSFMVYADFNDEKKFWTKKVFIKSAEDKESAHEEALKLLESDDKSVNIGEFRIKI